MTNHQQLSFLYWEIISMMLFASIWHFTAVSFNEMFSILYFNIQWIFFSATYPILSNLGLSSFYPQPLSKECLDSIFIFAIGDLIGSSLDNSLIQNGFSTLPPSLRCIAAEIKTLYEYFVRQYSQFDNVSPRNDGEVTILINRPKRIGRK